MEEKNKISRREKNKQKVTKCALDIFIENGIESTRIGKIASRSQLTERSIFRYFNTKADLVLAAALLFWSESIEKINSLEDTSNDLTGIEQIHQIFTTYVDAFEENQKKFIFIHEAEAYLSRYFNNQWEKYKPIILEISKVSNLSKAIAKGLKDGTVSNKSNLNYLYLNSFDALLGLMQKLAINYNAKIITLDDVKKRLHLFCDLLTDAFK